MCCDQSLAIKVFVFLIAGGGGGGGLVINPVLNFFLDMLMLLNYMQINILHLQVIRDY